MRWKGVGDDALATLLGVPRLVVLDEVPSTQDVAHALAADGAPSGTVVLADAQTAGRGRQGRVWRSEPGLGIWLTMIERPAAREAVQVLSLRLGLRLAEALDRWSPEPVLLKWPNDLLLADGKLAGILVEARWREARVDWVAIGVGLNVRRPEDGGGIAALREGTSRLEVLRAVVAAVRSAAAGAGPLSDAELAGWRARDAAHGRRCLAPAVGVVEGIDADGALLVRTSGGVERVRAGSLVFEERTC